MCIQDNEDNDKGIQHLKVIFKYFDCFLLWELILIFDEDLEWTRLTVAYTAYSIAPVHPLECEMCALYSAINSHNGKKKSWHVMWLHYLLLTIPQGSVPYLIHSKLCVRLHLSQWQSQQLRETSDQWNVEEWKQWETLHTTDQKEETE